MWRWAGCAVTLVLILGSAREVHGTVYTWLDDGVRHFTNSASEVPESQRSTARSFVTTPAPGGAEEAAPSAHPSGGGDAGEERSALEAAYGRGVERGAALALEQTRVVGELARSLVEMTLRREPAPLVAPARPAPAPVERMQRSEPAQPAFRVSIVPAGDRWPGVVGYGYAAPIAGCAGCCCASGVGYGFGFGRLVPHSHFFPSLAGARRVPLFFPGGHHLDADRFLVGPAFWVE